MLESKIIQSIEESKNFKDATVYDIDFGIECVKSFVKKTIPFTKEFSKLAKKQNGKNPLEQEKLVLQFVKKNLLSFFETEVIEKFFKGDELSYLESKVLYTYIFGLYVIGHGKKLEENQDKGIARTLVEMSQRANKEKSLKVFQENLNQKVERGYF